MKSKLSFLLTAVVASVFVVAASAADPDKPNIVFILADDLGYGELGCYGQEKILTPNVDRLAAEGMRFTQHYTGAPVCAPARCVLMTGKNLAHAEIRGNKDSGNGRVFPGQWPITDDAVTIAEVLKGEGYATGAFGKWGLGPSNSSGSPIKQGFDRYYGYNCQRNAHSYYPLFLDSDEQEIMINRGLIYGHQRKPNGKVDADDYRLENYAPDMILDEALKFIDANKDQPFFLYLPFVEPHVSIQSPQQWIDRYPEAWDKEKGAYRGQNGYVPHPRPRAAYAAMISDLDEHVGTVMQRLEEHGLTDNTLIIFTSDNGTTHPSKDPQFNVGGVDAEFFNSTGGLRGWKGSVYEGGIRVPCVVKWPGKVEAGSETDVPTYFPDWFPTLAKVANAAAAPADGLDGVDLGPLLSGGEAAARDELMIWDFANYGGLVAIRDGKWKALRRDVAKQKPTPWELYDVEADIAEANDLAAEHPDVVKRLEKAFIDTRVVEPDFPSPTYDPLTR